MPETPIPDWVTETPPETEYELIAWADGISVQEVDLTRDEYIALKLKLASMRGYAVPKPEDEVEEPDTKAPKAYALTPKVLGSLQPEQREHLDVCLQVLREFRGTVTPAEQFLWSLILMYGARHFSPEDAAHELEEFRENFEMIAESTRKMLRDYPDLVKAGDQ